MLKQLFDRGFSTRRFSYQIGITNQDNLITSTKLNRSEGLKSTNLFHFEAKIIDELVQKLLRLVNNENSFLQIDHFNRN